MEPTVVTIVIGDGTPPVVTGNDVPKVRALALAQVLASIQAQLLTLAAAPDEPVTVTERNETKTEPVSADVDMSPNRH